MRWGGGRCREFISVWGDGRLLLLLVLGIIRALRNAGLPQSDLLQPKFED